jgi:hypothetical protein
MFDNLKENVLVRPIHSDDNDFIWISKNNLEKVVYFGYTNDIVSIEKELSKEELELVNNEWSIIQADEDHDYLTNLPYEKLDYIFKKLKMSNEAHDIDDCMVLEYADCTYDKVLLTVDWYSLEDNRITQSYLSDCESQLAFSHWDGHNWHKIDIEDIDEDTIDFDDDEIEWISLDIWDGRNWAFQGNYCHGRIAKYNDIWLFNHWCDYQGQHNWITPIYSKEELEDFFAENGLDAELMEKLI